MGKGALPNSGIYYCDHPWHGQYNNIATPPVRGGAENMGANLRTEFHRTVKEGESVKAEPFAYTPNLEEEVLRTTTSEQREEFMEAMGRIDAELGEPSLDICPGCGGPADNGFDRCVPPNPYYCTKCSAPPPWPKSESNSVIYWPAERAPEKCPTCNGYHVGGCHRATGVEPSAEPRLRALAKTMGDAGYCNYDACMSFLRQAYEFGAAATRVRLEATIKELETEIDFQDERNGALEAENARLREAFLDVYGRVAGPDLTLKDETWSVAGQLTQQKQR